MLRTSDTTRPAPRPLLRCYAGEAPWVEAPIDQLLERAARSLDAGEPELALACAEEAARQEPRSVEAQHDKALALLKLGRLDDARDAIALTLALSPEDPESLALAADAFINHLSPSADRTAIGLEYAKRGRRACSARQGNLLVRLLLLEAQAMIDLGRSNEALSVLARIRRLAPENISARYEQGVAHFELCQFAAAADAFRDVLAREPYHAHALYHLGLVDERRGERSEADGLIARAAAHDPRSFVVPPSVSPDEFDKRLRGVVASLPPEIRADLARVPLEVAEIPDIEDLTAEIPPLSPTILGLYRGLPLGLANDGDRAPAVRGLRGGRLSGGRAAAADSLEANLAASVPGRAIVLYRRNILRSLATIEELDAAVERTLLHEIGHLHGEDDGSLRDRGLE
jgi:Flp pilus assembly protein TadD